MTAAITRHGLHEDALAFLTATAAVALGLLLMAEAGLLTGGVPGLALLASHATGLPFPPLLLLLNAPFYLLAFLRMGRGLALRSLAAVLLLALLSALMPGWVAVARLEPAFAALMGGALIGLGLLILFRHRSSLGGVGLLALWAQERHGLRAGLVQMAADALILLGAFAVLDLRAALLSLLGTAALNLVVATNHRPGRYLGAS